MVDALVEAILPTDAEIKAATEPDFGVVGGSEIPAIWMFADSLVIQLALVIIVPGYSL